MYQVATCWRGYATHHPPVAMRSRFSSVALTPHILRYGLGSRFAKAVCNERDQSESAHVEAARQARLDKHPSFRRLLCAFVVSSGGTQGDLAARLGCSPCKLSGYMTGMRRGKCIQLAQLSSIYSDLTHSLHRAKLPSTEALWLSAQSGVQPTAPSPPSRARARADASTHSREHVCLTIKFL